MGLMLVGPVFELGQAGGSVVGGKVERLMLSVGGPKEG